ncbi:cytochrome b/b6 domain-containing protein [Vibrio sp. SCSIO 43137]|uniref:cytochrome b/b6 domain-containing protein n=1 Tax=Vibrio sp. SCSIO 43137 TaxID=3021011 RepID=UPI00230752FA|nr:cytochrome b/b6 domain-containing protein [Vibrio sp. SCSIO 43137]WCE32093.1 cytochrome b/b6 domain-containing protein [Vibrio sp. SCSIO 43137]
MFKLISKTFGVVVFVLLTTFCAQASSLQSQDFKDKARELRAQVATDNESCLSCHASDSINSEWKTERGRSLDLYVDTLHYNDSVHQTQNCQSCHQGADNSAFETAPHRFEDNMASRSCDSCHGEVFGEIDKQLEASHHTKTIVEKFGHEFECQACHNAHSFKFPERAEDIVASIHDSNEACFSCHNDLRGYEKLTDKKLLDQEMGHWFLPEKNKHFEAVRCVDCHSAGEGTQIHTITSAEDAVSDCKLCHNDDSALTSTLYKYSNETKAFSMLDKGIFDDSELIKKNAQFIEQRSDKADSPYGFINQKLLNGRYLIGATRIGWMDSLLGVALLAILALLGLHLRMRKLGEKANIELEKTDTVMFPTGIRLWHNTNVIVFVTLLVSGLSMHFSLVAFEFSQYIHNILGAALGLFWLLYLFYLLFSGQIKQYLPRKNFIADAIKQGTYYLKGIHKGEENPAGHNPDKRLNPLQQMGYLSIVFGAFPLLILSGIGLFFNELLPAEIFGFDGQDSDCDGACGCGTCHAAVYCGSRLSVYDRSYAGRAL